jgi:vacuolar-type H+-ATPase subunit E/Vma4
MTISKNSDSGVEAEKLKNLCNLVLHRADVEHDKIIDDARNGINLWVNEQQATLDAECDAIAKDASKRANEIEIRQITNAKSECSHERMKLQNKYVDEAYSIFQDKLEALRGRGDYKEILAGLAFEAIERFPKGQDISLRLSGADAGLGEEIAAMINRAMPVNITFDPVPGEFSGGVMILSSDGHWSIVSDWRAKTEELADTIAARVLAAL